MEWLGVDRSRLGTALLLFGVIGMVLAAVIAAGLVGGAISARNLNDRLQSEQVQLVEMLGRLNDSVDHLATSTDNAGQTLRTTQAVVEAVGGVASGLGSTASRLGSALDVNILGQRPFAGAAESLGSVSTQLDTLGTQVTALATNVETNADDMSQVAVRVREMSQDLKTITDRIEAFDRTGEVVSLIVGGILLGGLLVAWIAIAAAFCAWVGWRLRHIGREDRPPSA
jgi:methyl-accepting chemotaxis protein